MDDELKNLDDYVYVFNGFYDKFQNFINEIENAIDADKETFGDNKKLRDDSSITIQVCGSRIKILFIINPIADTGYIKWYHIYFDEKEQKDRGELMCQQYFDYNGNIFEDESKKNAISSMRFRFDKYLKATLLTIFKDLDKKSNY